MALVFIDGAQGYNTAQMGRKYTSLSNTPTVNATSGRRSGPGIRLSNYNSGVGYELFTSQATWIVGFAYRTSALPAAARSILQIVDSGTQHITICLNAAGTIEARRGSETGTLLGTSTATITINTYCYLEIKVLISDTVGTVDIRKDGVSILALTAQDTRNAANATANAILLGEAASSTAATIDFDDIYICDGTGSAPQNTFLGDCRVDTTFPNGAGNLSQWTPSAGSNFQNVDEDPADDDTTYNFASVAATRDLYAFPDIVPTSGTVFGVAVNMTVRKDDAAVRTFRDLVRSGGANFAGATTFTATASYAMYTQIHSVDPNTSAAWSIANVNLAEYGIDLVA